jgi:hypothetical protein
MVLTKKQGFMRQEQIIMSPQVDFFVNVECDPNIKIGEFFKVRIMIIKIIPLFTQIEKTK